MKTTVKRCSDVLFCYFAISMYVLRNKQIVLYCIRYTGLHFDERVKQDRIRMS